MHIVAMLWGFAGVVGGMATADSSILTAGRGGIALIALLIIFGPTQLSSYIKGHKHFLLPLFFVGALFGIHWICFFESIARGGIALGLITYTTSPIFGAFGESLLKQSPFSLRTLFAAILSLIGIWFIHPINTVEALLSPAFLFGIASAITISMASLLGKRLLLQDVPSPLLTIGQLIGATLVSIPLGLSHVAELFDWTNIIAVVTLGLVCSTIGQTLFNKALKVIPVGTAGVIASMEAPYGVLLAALIAHQPLTVAVVIGTSLVTVAAVLVSLRH